MSATCDACGATLPTELELREHAKVHDGGTEEHVHYDCGCGEVFESEAELRQHAAVAH